MTRGADIIAAIILLALAIAIIVYLLHWLYRRSSKEVSFVRTGMLGEKVVISGGAFVLPIIHNITLVGMRTLSITIKRGGDKSLITKDRMRAELVTEFFTKVPADERAVATAAQTLGNRTLDPEHLREVVQGRFADALGEVAAKMTLDEIQENRGQFVKEVTKIADASIGHTGLALETVSIISLDQTPIEQFNPANTFDSQGLTQLTEQIESRKKKRNAISQDTRVSIENKNLETIQKELEIKKNEEFSRYNQEREIAILKAKDLNQKQIDAHDFIKSDIMGEFMHTGVQFAINVTVFKLLKMNSIYPVAIPEKLSDKNGRVLPDLILLKDGSTIVDLAKEIHSDLIKGLLYAKDIRYNLRVPTNYQLRDRDVISLVSASKK